MDTKKQADLDNRANQLNPDNSEFEKSRRGGDAKSPVDKNGTQPNDAPRDNDEDGFQEEWIPHDAT